ncbi:MAG: M48 family metallopeptidase [Patescibacteria group bacterium]|nr:M48 family metallopeptidase [Patescibacteria group bacterium]MDE2438281.1 M48 family metallopeptidase [Patescibacteria group bacterium]
MTFIVFFVVVIGVGFVFAEAYDNPPILYSAVLLSIVMSIISYWYSDKIVLGMAGAHEVQEDDAPELYHLVENLAITAGLPTPKIYIVPERQPNAFATGRDPQHAVVAVTEGLLQIMNRSELEGVLAHELSHVGNRDMLLSTIIVILVGFISLLANWFLRSWMWGGFRSRDEEQGNNAFFIIAGIVLSILAPLALTLMQLAISRKRESLADASGALLTRYPEGLADALQKIADHPVPMQCANPTTAHLWLNDPYEDKKTTPWLHTLFMTHPPIEERIKALREM